VRLKTPEPDGPDGDGGVFRLADYGLFSTTDFAGWPDEALESRERAGFPTSCEPDKPICVSRGAVCRLCGARDEAW
jgi:hypothetical protein